MQSPTDRLTTVAIAAHTHELAQGYLCVTRDNTAHIWDSQFRKSMLLDVGSGPPPGMHVLPYTTQPEHVGPLHPGHTAHNVIARQNLSRYSSKVVAEHMSKAARVRAVVGVM